MKRLSHKFATAATLLPEPVIQLNAKSASVGLVFYGSTLEAIPEAVALLMELGVKANSMRVRGFPFGAQVLDFIDSHDQVFVIEQNRDGQLRTLLCNELTIDPAAMTPILHYDGLAITGEFIADSVQEHLLAQTNRVAG